MYILSYREQKILKYSAGQSLASLLRTNRPALAVHISIRYGIWPSARITLRVNILRNISVVTQRVWVKIIALKQLQPRRYMPGVIQNLRLIDIYSPIVDANFLKRHMNKDIFLQTN